MKCTRGGIVFVAVALVIGGAFFFTRGPSHQEIIGKEVSVLLPDISVSEEVSDAEYHAPVSIVFGGDMMFDRYIRTVMRRHGGEYVFAPLEEIISGADAVVANLEGPITENESISETSAFGARENYIFTFPVETAALLKKEHISIVSLGNNHILNFKASGAESTKRILSDAKVEYFGSPIVGDERVLVKELGSMKIAFVNYNQFVFQGKEKAFEDIATARAKADIVVLFTHWGKEYEPALPSIKELAHQFVDAGVDAIIGSHPHVVQEKETYHGKTIYYSLGNLVFDQYFREDTMRGLLVRMTIDPSTTELSFEDIPVALDRTGRTTLGE